jgi:hypothetical protein
MSALSTTSDKITGDLAIALPTNITVPLLKPAIDVASISQYSSSTGNSSFIVERTFGEGRLFYFNINPVLKAFDFSTNQSAFQELISVLLKDVNLKKLDPNAIFNFDAVVKEISARNTVEIKTPSAIFPTQTNLKQIDIVAEDGSHTFCNVTHIEYQSNYSLAMITDNVLLNNGNGFYATIETNSTIVINSVNGLMSLAITTDKGETLLNGVSEITITPTNSIRLTTRTPSIKATEVSFLEFYPEGSLRSSTRTYGQNLKVTGTTEFTIMLSDSYSFLKNVKLGTSFQQDPPQLNFNELSTIPAAIFSALSLTLIIIPVICFTLILPRKQSKRNRVD